MSKVFYQRICVSVLNMFGSCKFSLSNFTRCFARLYAGALRQCIIGRMGLFGLCNFINALRVGG
jgi:hypothetical protein